ncbi:serine/threonine-protein kinase pim-2-like [Triplophysa rosa]|uniref:serine/threonine-protein kinase pim-2-like n=1 Tax=Triplophysa rosa TaxID=992332 RepID=UPI00254600E6|nr:serine/threonine-protein kinase pim-2-like [Triplophysa rosa]
MSAGHSQSSGKSSIIHVCRKRKHEEESQQLQKKWKLEEEDARHGYEDTSGPYVTLPASYKPLRSLKLPKSVFSDEGDSKRDESNILRDTKKRKSPDQLDSEHPQKKQRFNPEHNCYGRPYTQGHLLGEGGFGSVYAGNRISDGLKVAIKYVSKDLIDEQLEVEGQGLLPIEVALMIRVNSDPACPNILHLIEWFETPEHYIMILERPDPCKDLDKFCYEQGNLEESQAKRVLVQLIRALKHCESKGVLHRDVKPQNILIRTDTHDIKLLDFGCGDLLNDSDYKMFAGTLDYFPPEWYRYRSYRAGPATVWSVGVTLYNILCGTLPFKNRKDIIRGRLRFTRDLSIGKTGLTLNCP